MIKKLTIKELVIYYVDRYNLNTKYSSSDSTSFDDGLGTYKTAITRIIKNKIVGEEKLWDIINPDNKAHQISIEDFEKYCFKDWLKYIEKNWQYYNKLKLNEDKKRCELQFDYEYWNKQAEEVIQSNNRAMENQDFSVNNDECFNRLITDDDLEKKAQKMMIEAIYNVFYEPFKFDLLKYDLENSQIIDAGSYNPEITGQNFEIKSKPYELGKLCWKEKIEKHS